MLIGVIPGAAVPALIGVVGQRSRGSWECLFLVSAAIIIVTEGIYVVAIRPDVQDFDHQGESTQQTLPSPSKEVPDIYVPPNDNFATSDWPSDDEALTMLWTENPEFVLEEARNLGSLLESTTEQSDEDELPHFLPPPKIESNIYE